MSALALGLLFIWFSALGWALVRQYLRDRAEYREIKRGSKRR